MGSNKNKLKIKNNKMRNLKIEEVNKINGGINASHGAGISCTAAILGGAVLFFGTAGLGSAAAFSLGLAGCSGFGGAAITSSKPKEK